MYDESGFLFQRSQPNGSKSKRGPLKRPRPVPLVAFVPCAQGTKTPQIALNSKFPFLASPRPCTNAFRDLIFRTPQAFFRNRTLTRRAPLPSRRVLNPLSTPSRCRRNRPDRLLRSRRRRLLFRRTALLRRPVRLALGLPRPLPPACLGS
jgi:hypothetical protein